MLFWMQKVTAEVAAASPTERALVRRSLFANLAIFETMCRVAKRKPTKVEQLRMAKAMEDALRCYNYLAYETHQVKKRNWKVVPKFHYVTHSAYDQSKVTNPRWVHVYADEDMVGKVKKIVVACHAKTASTRVLERYNILFGARWLRALMAARGLKAVGV